MLNSVEIISLLYHIFPQNRFIASGDSLHGFYLNVAL